MFVKKKIPVEIFSFVSKCASIEHESQSLSTMWAFPDTVATTQPPRQSEKKHTQNHDRLFFGWAS